MAQVGLKAFQKDVATMFENAMKYNPPETIYYQEAKRLKKLSGKLMDKLHAELQALGGGPRRQG
jgi:hypothetical protein